MKLFPFAGLFFCKFYTDEKSHRCQVSTIECKNEFKRLMCSNNSAQCAYLSTSKEVKAFFLQKTVEFWQCAHYMQSSCPAKFWAKLDSLNFCIFTCEFYCYIHYVNTSIMDCNCFKSFP